MKYVQIPKARMPLIAKCKNLHNGDVIYLKVFVKFLPKLSNKSFFAVTFLSKVMFTELGKDSSFQLQSPLSAFKSSQQL